MRLARSGAKSIRELAADLGCSEPTLRSWVAQDMVDAGEAEGLTADERAHSPRGRGI